MRPPLAYVPRRGPLSEAGAGAAIAYLGSFAVVAFACWNPIVLAAAAVSAVLVGIAVGAGRAVGFALRLGGVMAVVFVAVNALAAQRGDTILVRGYELPVLGRLDVSAEAVAEGGLLALRVLVVLVAFAVQSASVDPDRMLRLLRPLARRSALTATLIARLVPLAASDLVRLREAAALRGPAAAPAGRAALAQRLVSGSLDRAVGVAATLELRGYGRGAPRWPGHRRRPARARGRFLAAGLAIAGVAIAAVVTGVGRFDAYPVVSVDAGPATLALAAAIPVLAAAPLVPWLWRSRRRRDAGARGELR